MATTIKRQFPAFFGILSKGPLWIDPGDDIDFRAVPALGKGLMNPGAEFNATTGLMLTDTLVLFRLF
jgi:hypothetical protein